MKYLILIIYAVVWYYLSDLFGSGFDVAIIGGVIRATGASKDARRFQRLADNLNPVRPEYKMPGEVDTSLQVAQNLAQGDMAGYGRSMDQAQGNTANMLSASRGLTDSGTGALQVLAQGDTAHRRNVNDINMQNVSFRQGNQRILQNALMTKAGYKDQEFDTNQMQPYLQEESDKRQFQEAAWNQKAAARDSWASVADGVTNIAMTALGAPMGAGGQSMFGSIFGGGGGGTPQTNAIASPDRGIPSMKLNMPNSGIYR